MFLSRLKAGIVIFNYRDYNNMLRKTEGIIKLFLFLFLFFGYLYLQRRYHETVSWDFNMWDPHMVWERCLITLSHKIIFIFMIYLLQLMLCDQAKLLFFLNISFIYFFFPFHLNGFVAVANVY